MRGHGRGTTIAALLLVAGIAGCLAIGLAWASLGSSPGPVAPQHAYAGPLATAAAPVPSCDRVASPFGSDSATGTPSDPFRTAQRLVSSLSAGMTGCLAPGTYAEDVTVAAGGTGETDRVVLTSVDPFEPATIAGRFYVAHSAAYTTVTGLRLDGQNPTDLPSPTVDADHVTFSDDDVTNDNSNAVCFIVGSNIGYGPGDDFLADHDVVHNCGVLATRDQQSPDPLSGFYEHAFYMENTAGFRITQTIMYGIANRCVQLYPHAVDGEIDHNLCVGAGTGVIVDSTSSGNTITRNIITGASVQGGIAQGSTLVGGGNVADQNVLWDDDPDLYQVHGGDLVVTGVLGADPQYTDATSGNYRLQPGSPAAGYGPDSIQP
jgi:hypothetical protein